MDADFPPGMVDEWRTFLASGKAPHAVFDTNLCFPLQRKGELKLMLETAMSVKPVTVMEIGADKGGGLLHWCYLPTVKQVIACEIRGTPYADEFKRAFPDKRFLWIEDSSYTKDTRYRVQSWLGLSWIDVLFIDGDKTKMVEDFDTYLPLMNPNGLVFVHDVSDREPMAAFGKLWERGHRTWIIEDRTDTREALDRQGKGIPPANPHEAWLRHWKGESCTVGVIELGGSVR